MIATHNIKVNDKWYHAGDMIPDADEKQAELPVEAAKEEVKPEAPAEEPKEEPKEQPKARTTSRRKK